MYTRFYDNTAVTMFIKALLSQTNIPLVHVWNPGDFVIKDMVYITKGNIVQALQTGIANSIKEFKIIDIYIPSKFYPNINSPFYSNIESYDPTTHYWLGKYLRFVRDYYDVNLMPLYNCFTGEVVSNVNFSELGVISGSVDNRYRIIAVPIQFGTTYNLAVDSDLPIEYIMGFYGPKGLLQIQTEKLNSIKNTYTVIPSLQFTSPYCIPPFEWSELIQTTRMIGQFERYLRLFIKIPADSISSVVVIEGDISRKSYLPNMSDDEAAAQFSSKSGVYTNLLPTCNSKSVKGVPLYTNTLYFNKRNAQSPSENAYQNFTGRPIEQCVGPLGLLQWTDSYIYAFSNTLIEYLLLNAITKDSSIGDNIEYVQQRISSSDMSSANLFPRYSESYTVGVWDDSMQKYLYTLRNAVKSPKGVSCIDNLGFVDKNLETILERGKRNNG